MWVESVSTDFLDRLASQLKTNKSAVCRRAIQRILAVVKKNFEDGKYKNDVEAEADFRQLVDRDEGCTR
jgi:predicted transcriptional regulator